MNKNKLITVTMLSGLLVTPIAQATNGYFGHGYGTKEKGLAGAGVAYSQDAMAAATNPAGMALVGERMDVGLALFSPSDRSFTISGTPNANQFVNADISTGPATFTSENDLFFIPQFGYNMALDSESTLGVSVYGNGGMNTEFGPAGTGAGFGIFGNPLAPFDAGTAGVNLEQMFINTTYARKLGAKQAYGVSLIVAAQRFAAQGIAGFAGFSTDGANMAGNIHSYSYGAGVKLGYQGEVAPNFSVGVSYQSKMAMGEFDEYKGLFAEAGGFDIPSTYTVGLAYDLGASGKVVLDMQKINYSEVASIANPVQNIFNCPAMGGADATACFGGSNGPGFGWEDMTIMKLGYEIDVDGTVYRVGYSVGDMPIPASQTFLNILAPAVMEQHITFGMTMPMGTDQEFNLAVMIAPSASVKGANPFDGGSAFGGTDIEIEMEQKEIQVGWAWKY